MRAGSPRLKALAASYRSPSSALSTRTKQSARSPPPRKLRPPPPLPSSANSATALTATPNPSTTDSGLAARERARCPPALLRDALASDPSEASSVYTSGRWVADPRDWPRPTEHLEYIFQLAAPHGTLRAVSLARWEQHESVYEACYIDGACYPHAVPSLACAGGVGVFMSGDKVVPTASALV